MVATAFVKFSETNRTGVNVPGVKHEIAFIEKNLFYEKVLLRSPQFFITCYFIKLFLHLLIFVALYIN